MSKSKVSKELPFVSEENGNKNEKHFTKEQMNKYKRALKRSQRHIKMLGQWLELYQQGFFLIGSYLRFLGYESVAVFSTMTFVSSGHSKRDFAEKLLLQELSADPNINLACILGENQRTLGDVPTVNPAESLQNYCFDAVIVPERRFCNKASKQLPNHPILSLEEIIETLHSEKLENEKMVETLLRLNQQGIKSLVVGSPNGLRVKNPSEFEKCIPASGYAKDLEKFFYQQKLDEHYSFREYKSLIGISFPILPYKNYWHHTDLREEKVNFIDHERVTTDVPDNYKKTIHVFGDSTIVAHGVEDYYTPPSSLQRLLNDYSGNEIRVINHGMVAAGMLALANKINDTIIEKTDIVVVVRRNSGISGLFENTLKTNGIDYYDSQPDFNRPHKDGKEKEVFRSVNHLNYRGSEMLGQSIYDALIQNNLITDNATSLKRTNHEKCKSDIDTWNSLELQIPFLEESAIDYISQSEDFRKYIEMLKNAANPDSELVGAIVMNCNPFTKGHQYLIESCSARVDQLYIFAVEEDLSDFPFEDRFALIEAGTEHLENVTVLPSGKFIISTLTFPEYFKKGDLQNASVDPSGDIELFAKYIAPALNIQVRFVGEEPLDKVTLQYNQTMQRILPEHGIRFEVLKRKEHDGDPISASRVRRLIAENNYSAIAEIVPESTYEYLIRKHGVSGE